MLNRPWVKHWAGKSASSAICVQSVDAHVSCSSHSDAQLAAFFIDPRAKWSTVQCYVSNIVVLQHQALIKQLLSVDIPSLGWATFKLRPDPFKSFRWRRFLRGLSRTSRDQSHQRAKESEFRLAEHGVERAKAGKPAPWALPCPRARKNPKLCLTFTVASIYS